ncbi:DNA polymerase I [Nitrincola tapanii]|uniref:DNA polymerase I n=1 Tax=Nitrincola tapanii TaxID=1708751 RepID=A0A5A9VZ00_9GAMM|nr:DNA polymerase I [Nitrincola tapanii]KAA0873706.1 DNA polymerase I [Nitrincola tapanii]
MSEQLPPVILVDGSSYLYRAFFASQQADLRTQEGFPTGAIRVVTSMLRSLLRQYPDSPVTVVFDAKGKTFRDEIYPEYKAQRPSMPDDLRLQVEPIHAIIQAMGIPILVEEGVEADDVIGTLAREATEKCHEVIISTGDKDMAQLVSEHVTLINTMNDTQMDAAGVLEKFGVPPELVIDLLALQGDKVDNIPGVPGVGEKTALALLQGLGGIEAIYARLDEVPNLPVRGAKSLATKLAQHRHEAELSYQLATIKTDVPLHLRVDQIPKPQPDIQALLPLFRQFEFKSWVAELEQGGAVVADMPSTPPIAMTREVETLLSWEAFESWQQALEQAEVFALDTETTSLNYMEAELVGISFAIEPGKAAYLPLAHDYVGVASQLDRKEVLARLKPLLEDPGRGKVGQHIKYDMNVLARYGIQLQGVVADTMLESYVLDSTAGRHDMDSLAQRFLGVKTTSFEALAGKGKQQLTFNQIDLEAAAAYAGEDADITLRLHQHLLTKLQAEPELLKVFSEIEMPLVPILAEIEQTGAQVDAQLLGQQSQELEKRLAELEAEAYELAGETFNLSSPKQLQVLLYEKQGIPVTKKTPKGAPSTAEEVLQELALDYPLPKVILEHRGLSKLKSTYTDKLPQMIQPSTGRIHTSYHQAVTATGRLSSSDPNLQNIPVRTQEGRRIRQAFTAPVDHLIVAADYSQIELRIMAHLSGDAGLLRAFSAGEDIHRATAAEVFGVTLEQVSAEQRRRAKAINFGLIYGMSAFGLARQLGVGRNEAQAYIDHYFATYPGVQHYMESTREQAHQLGYVQTLFGRRLYLPEINARNRMRQQAAERTAINAPMQGTAADIIKRAMVKVDQWLKHSRISARMIMQVHDELVFEVKKSDLEAFIQGVVQPMESAAELKVPLRVEVDYGESWEQAH